MKVASQLINTGTLKLTLSQCPAIGPTHVIAHYTTAPFYNIIIIFDRVVRQKRHFKHTKQYSRQCRHLTTFIQFYAL